MGRRGCLRLGSIGIALIATLAFAAPAQASAPPPPPQGSCAPGPPITITPTVAIPDLDTLTSVLAVGGRGAYTLDVDVTTIISHTSLADLDITLTSPAGTVVTLTTNNGPYDDSFLGTLWDDDAGDANPPGAVTDTDFLNDVVETPLVPEEALGAFIGENPNGNWTLSVADELFADTGTLASWSLQLTTCAAPLPATPFGAANAGLVPIPDEGATTSQIAVSGACPYLTDVNATTNITHTFGADLDITLTSPAGTVVTLTTDNGYYNNVFSGTLWDDDAGDSNAPGAITDAVFEDFVAETPLVPEEALGAFVGENPNGTWTLSVVDDAALDTGSFIWSLSGTAVCAAPTVTISDVTVREGNRATKPARFLVRLSAPTTLPVTLKFATQNGTGKARSDYRPKRGTLTLAPGSTELQLVIRVRGDRRDEKRERFFVVLSNAANATFVDARGRATIRDND